MDMSSVAWEGSDQRLRALPEGRSIHVHVTDPGVAGEWTLHSEPDVITAERGHARADVALRGPATSLLLVLMRRTPASGSGVEVLGDAAILDGWLDVVRF
jgi:predicted lipid carrier protein YhbT